MQVKVENESRQKEKDLNEGGCVRERISERRQGLDLSSFINTYGKVSSMIFIYGGFETGVMVK